MAVDHFLVGCHIIDFAMWFSESEPLSVRAEHASPSGHRDRRGLDDSDHARQLSPGTGPGHAGSTRIRLRGARSRSKRRYSTPSTKSPSGGDGGVQSNDSRIREPATIRSGAARPCHLHYARAELEEFARSIAESRAPAITSTDGTSACYRCWMPRSNPQVPRRYRYRATRS